jgi:hypothetical protein
MKFVLPIIAMLIAPVFSFAGVITFDLRAPIVETLDEVNSFDYTVNGVTATLTALPQTYLDTDGVLRNLLLNRTNSGFGVDVEGVINSGGCVNEDSDAIDAGCVREAVLVELDTNAILLSIAVSSFGAQDQGTLAFENPALTDISIVTTGTTLANELVGGPGNRFQVIQFFDVGDGFSFDSFTINTVPEPETLALLAFGLAGIGYQMHRKLKGE